MKLEIGYNHPIEIREYAYPLPSLAGTRILYLSDLHYHRLSRRRVIRNIRQVQQIAPDFILLGGDYVDTPFGLQNFQYLLESIAPTPIFAIAGNHDTPYLRRVRRIVENAGATWLHNQSTAIKLGATRIQIDGNRPALSSNPDLSILCLHYPMDIRPFAHQYNLIFAGHLHGGQIVLQQTPKDLATEHGKCRYLISKGAGDTLPIRYNCSRDMILVTLQTTPAMP